MESQLPLQGYTALVVEDEILVRLCTVQFLEDAGYRVLEASNGQEALAMLEKHHEIGILVTDVHMPGEPDGLVLARLTALTYPHIRLLVVSGKAMLRNELIPGDGRFLPKPFSQEQIAEAIRQVLV